MAGKIDNFTPEEFEQQLRRYDTYYPGPSWPVVAALSVLGAFCIAVFVAIVVKG